MADGGEDLAEDFGALAVNDGEEINTSKKHEKFIKDKMKEKTVFDIPGIGPTIGNAMEKDGFHLASKVLGKYLMSESESEFTKWVGTFGADKGQQQKCFNGLKEWCEKHL